MPFTVTQTSTAITHLFGGLWKFMVGRPGHYTDCMQQVKDICTIVNRHGNHDDRLIELDNLTGIGPPIASGILWSLFPDECVPFDKHTMGYCTIDWKVISNHVITNGSYSQKCTAIVAQLGKHAPPFGSIELMVRHAWDNVSHDVTPI